MRSLTVNINASDQRHADFTSHLQELIDGGENGGDGLPLVRPLRVIQDVQTRWNSTTRMLIRFRKLLPAIEHYVNVRGLHWLALTKSEWDGVSYLINLTQPLALCTSLIGQTKAPTLCNALNMYNMIFDVLEKAEKRLRRKQVLWKRQMLEAVQAAVAKLRKYYGATCEKFGDFYGLAVLLSPSSKNRWNKKRWNAEEVEHYWVLLERMWRARYAHKRAPLSQPTISISGSTGLDLQEFLCPASDLLDQDDGPEESEFMRYKRGSK